MNLLTLPDALKAFKGKKVFVTGHTGFKGSWLTSILLELGADVMGYALPPISETSHFELLDLKNKISHIEGDLGDYERLTEALSKFNPEFVFHLAAQALVKRSYDNPMETMQSNIMGSVHLLEAVRHCSSVKSLVFITSDKCYENVEWIWGYRENDRLGGRDPYSASKGAAELVFSTYLRSYFDDRATLGAASTRAGNVIGGGDWAADRIIPDCVRAAQVNGSIYLRSPTATRPWQHVLEPLSGYLLLAANLFFYPKKFSGSWNFGPSSREARTVHEVAAHIMHSIGAGKVDSDKNTDHMHEAKLLQLNCDKAHQILNWYPRWNFEKTLHSTAFWYKSWLDGKEMAEITNSQIKDYFRELL